jgi:hypothetical protein
MKRPPWHSDLLRVAATPEGELLDFGGAGFCTGVVIFVGADAVRTAWRAREALLLAEADELAVWARAAEVCGLPPPGPLVRRWGITFVPPGSSPWLYDWSALAGRTALVTLLDDAREPLRVLGEALLAAGARRVLGVDARPDKPRLVAEIVARQAA